MTNLKIGTFMFAIGLTIGGVSSFTSRATSPALAEDSPDMTMGAQSRMQSKGDSEMSAAMTKMMQSMKTSKMTGVQDRDFMLMMVPHHQSAVDMAKIELRRGTHPELLALARDIIKSQDAEIAQMNAWLRRWYSKS